MARVVKIAAWTVVFIACASVGAYVAAHTDPFPPGVEDPGARPDVSGPGELPPGSLAVRIDTRTFHDLYVGGRCVAAWRIELAIGVRDGAIEGTGAATIKDALRCDEPTAQIQAERIDLRVVGSLADGELAFRLKTAGREPDSAQELSGFASSMPTLRFLLPAREGATASFDVRVPDRDRGTYGAVGTVVVETVPER